MLSLNKLISRLAKLLCSCAIIAGCMQHTLVASAATCAPGTALGVTPISLKKGDKPGCYNTALAALAQKLLTSDANKSCKLCHAPSAVLYPTARVGNINSNMRKQGYSLKPAMITVAFNRHISKMLGAKMSGADAKAISNYLQSIK